MRLRQRKVREEVKQKEGGSCSVQQIVNVANNMYFVLQSFLDTGSVCDDDKT